MNKSIVYIILLILIILAHVFSYLFLFHYEKTGLLKKSKKEYYKKYFLYGPIYYISLLNKKNNIVANVENPTIKKEKIKSYISLALCTFLLLVFISIPIFQIINLYTYNEPPYYDLYQNKYKSSNEVIYYAEDGKKYRYIDNYIYEDCYFEEIKSHRRISVRDCFIDEKGYLIIIDVNKLTYDENRANIDNPYFWYDSKGNYYAPANSSYWNSSGKLVSSRFDVK